MPQPRRQRDRDPGGPYVTVACFCDSIEQKPDRSIDIVGIRRTVVVDPQTVGKGTTGAPLVNRTLAIVLAAGDFHGQATVGFRSLGGGTPSIVGTDVWMVDFSGDQRDSAVVAPFAFEAATGEGDYAFEVTLNGRSACRMWLKVVFGGTTLDRRFQA